MNLELNVGVTRCVDASLEDLMKDYGWEPLKRHDLDVLEKLLQLEALLDNLRPGHVVYPLEAGKLGCAVFDVGFYLDANEDLPPSFRRRPHILGIPSCTKTRPLLKDHGCNSMPP